jgi:hypothetical protein
MTFLTDEWGCTLGTLFEFVADIFTDIGRVKVIKHLNAGVGLFRNLSEAFHVLEVFLFERLITQQRQQIPH